MRQHVVTFKVAQPKHKRVCGVEIENVTQPKSQIAKKESKNRESCKLASFYVTHHKKCNFFPPPANDEKS